LVAGVCLRWIGDGASPTTSDEYIRAFHEQADHRIDPRPAVARVLASIGTIGYGGALGLEGPSIYAGSVVGAGLQRRFSRFFSREDAKLLLVAGAAAGVAAVFKAPAAGALFAIEVPYRADVARRNVLPAMVAAATSYLTFAAVKGTDPLLPVAGTFGFGWREIGGALLIGVLCGLGGRLFSVAINHLRSEQVAAAGALLALRPWVPDAARDAPPSLGPGCDAIAWAPDPEHGVWLVVLLLLVRVAAVMATYGAGGVGGLFIPLVVTGALTGRVAA